MPLMIPWVWCGVCGRDVIRWAAMGGHAEVLRLLARHGADPSIPDEQVRRQSLHDRRAI
jgi:hypothetical protein